MLRFLFPLSFPKKSILRSCVGYLVLYIVGSLIKGTIVYLTEFDMLGGIIGLVFTVYIFFGLCVLALKHFNLIK